MVAEIGDQLAMIRCGFAMLLRWRRRSEHGESVINVAIAVLMMAFLGAVMWAAFSGSTHSGSSRTGNNTNRIGTGGSTRGAATGGAGAP